MKDNLLELLRLINDFELDADKVNRIKNLICYFSEAKIQGRVSQENRAYIDTLIFQGSYKIRTFGYTYMSIPSASIDENELFEENGVLLRFYNNTRKELYRSSIYPNCYLDSRQKQVLDTFAEAEPRRLFISAPTSFGKTFLLKEIINRNYEEYKNIIIVLPTVALLHEVSDDLDEFFAARGFLYTIYSSIYRDMEIGERSVFILTPERAVRLFALFPDTKVDFFFYDEIYKIDEDSGILSEDDVVEDDFAGKAKGKKKDNENNRAVAFRIALYLLLKKTKDFYIAGPFIKMDSLKAGFVEFINRYNVKTLEFSFEPTMKNKIDFSTKQIVRVSPIDGKDTQQTDCERKPQKIEFLKKYLSIDSDNQTIFYCNYPSNTNKFAREYASTCSGDDVVRDSRFNFFIEHIRSNYGFSFVGNGGENDSEKYWSLLLSLEKGVGIHNGKLPKYFQKEIMQLFNSRSVPALFCTSTIIEGVNSNAKNIVLIHNPQGSTDEGKRFTLLNINGRAGRYLKHFVGNIVYLDEQQSIIEQSINISLDYKICNDKIALSDHDLENIDDCDLGYKNKARKANLIFDKDLLPDEVFFQNRLVERKRQEAILRGILDRKNFVYFLGIEKTTIREFVQSDYLEKILSIWFAGNRTPKQIVRLRFFAKNYAEKSYQGVLNYAFSKYLSKATDDETKMNEVDKVYNETFAEVKDVIEYKFPLILSLFESLLNQAYKIKGIMLEKPIDLSPIIRFYEVGVKTELGLFLSEKGLPVVTIKKIEGAKNYQGTLDEQKATFQTWYKAVRFMALLDAYERLLIDNIFGMQ